MCRFIGLSYSGNSCYQDSVLLCLLVIPNNFINKYILLKKFNNSLVKQIQNELIDITNMMRSASQYTCKNLRRLLRSLKSPQNFGGGETQDAGEFLQFLFDIFNVEIIKRQIKIYLSDSPNKTPTLSCKRIESMFPFIHIPYDKIKRDISISDFIEKIDDDIASDTKIRKVEYSKILDASFLVFCVQRTKLLINGNETRNYNNIYPDQVIRIGERNLELYGIIIHLGNHYTAYIKCKKNNWFFYNDMYDKLLKLGDYKDIFINNLDPRKYGTLYFYKEIE